MLVTPRTALLQAIVSGTITMPPSRYAGIGSRETPAKNLAEIVQIGAKLAKFGYVLRSGGAEGADKHFEIGCDQEGGKKEIYLPWKGFNKNPSLLYDITEKALQMAEYYHPAWDACSPAARKFMARNCYQVLGQDLNTPVDFVVCWTLAGLEGGGTGQALRIARDYSIPVYNLEKEADRAQLVSLGLLTPN